MDLSRLRRSLEKAGYEVFPDEAIAGVERFYVSDPFGNRLEFIQDGQGFAQRRDESLSLQMVPTAGGEVTGVSHDERAIRAVYANWFRAMEVGDVSASLDLVTDDIVFKRPSGAASVGKAELRHRLETFHAGVEETVEYEVQEVEVAGQWAYASVIERATVRPKGWGAAAIVSGMHLSILRKDEAGTWRIARDVSSLDGDEAS